MKAKRMGITEILRRIWPFSAKKIKILESGSKQPTQLIVELNLSLRHITVTKVPLGAATEVFESCCCCRCCGVLPVIQYG